MTEGVGPEIAGSFLGLVAEGGRLVCLKRYTQAPVRTSDVKNLHGENVHICGKTTGMEYFAALLAAASGIRSAKPCMAVAVPCISSMSYGNGLTRSSGSRLVAGRTIKSRGTLIADWNHS